MALREGAMRVPFSGGISTRKDPKTLTAVELLVLENGVFTSETSLEKRNGYEALSQNIGSSSALATGGIRLGARDTELLKFTSNRCYSRQTGVEQWSDAGAVFSVVGNDRPLIKTGTQQTMPDHATVSGVTVAAWEDSLGGVWWSVADTSGRVLRPAAQADAAGISPRCVSVGGNLHIYYVIAAFNRIMVIVVNPSAPGAAVTPAILVEDLDGTNPIYDATTTRRPDGNAAAIAWFEQGSTNIRIGYVDRSGVLGAPSAGYPTIITHPAGRLATSPLAIAFWSSGGDVLDGEADRLSIAYVSGATAGRITSFNGGDSSNGIGSISLVTAVVYTATAVTRVALALTLDEDSGSTMAWSAWEENSAVPSERFVVVASTDVNQGGAVAGPTLRSVGLASGAWAIDLDAFAVFVHDTTFFNTYVTMRLSDGAPVGRHVPASAGAAPTRKHLSTANVVGVVGSVSEIALPVRTRSTAEAGDTFLETGIALITLDFDNDSSHQTAQLGRGLYMAGACPMHYDGSVWSEQGFHFGPERIIAVMASGGSMTSSTTYEYRAWYEWTDSQGEVHLGPTSIGTLVTMGGGDTQVTLTLPTLRITGKPNARICVARSLAAKTGNKAQFFRVTSLNPSTSTGPNRYVLNNKLVDSVTFIDRMSDVTLATQEELYTDGGILSDDPSALGAVIARGQTRLFFSDPSDGNTVRFSQMLDDGFGVETPPELEIRCDPFGGDVTALAFQDRQGVIWKENAIFAFSGDGPAANGDASVSGFTSPAQVTSAVGCTNPASIVLTPNGHMFQTSKGIYMVGRDGSISYPGAAVEGFNAQVVRRATQLPNRTQIVFLTNDGSTLLYDYYHGQWSTFTNHEGLDSVVVDGVYHYLRNDGIVYRETVGQYTDAGLRIKFRVETAPLHMQPQLQGFSRFWFAHILGTWLSAHQLGVQYRTDYTTNWSDSFWLDATGVQGLDPTGWITGANATPVGTEPISGTEYGDGEYGAGIYGGTAPGVYQWRIQIDEKGEAIQFSFEDFERDGLFGQGFKLTELLLTGGVKNNSIRPFTKGRSL